MSGLAPGGRFAHRRQRSDGLRPETGVRGAQSPGRVIASFIEPTPGFALHPI